MSEYRYFYQQIRAHKVGFDTERFGWHKNIRAASPIGAVGTRHQSRKTYYRIACVY
jgi:hypothetical protein